MNARWNGRRSARFLALALTPLAFAASAADCTACSCRAAARAFCLPGALGKASEVMALTQNIGVDYAFETAGIAKLIESSLALTLADTLVRDGMQVAYFSLEMRRAELAQRLIAMRTGVGAQTQRQHRYTDTELPEVIAAISQIAELPIAVHDQRGLTVEDVRARTLRHAQAVGGVALGVVDYLTLVTAEQARGTNRAQAVGEISRGLKRLAGEADAPVLALAQLNRQLDGRTGWRPTLSDLKESGDIEADADQVVFIVRPELFETDPQRQAAARGIAKLYVEKNRHGPTGLAVVQFDGVRTTLRDLAPRWREPHGYHTDDDE